MRRGGRSAMRLGTARFRRRRHAEACIHHAERPGDKLADADVERHASDGRYHAAQHEEPDRERGKRDVIQVATGRGAGRLGVRQPQVDVGKDHALGFDLVRDNPMGPDQRWVQVAPKGAQTSITLVTWFPTMPLPGGAP